MFAGSVFSLSANQSVPDAARPDHPYGPAVESRHCELDVGRALSRLLFARHNAKCKTAEEIVVNRHKVSAAVVMATGALMAACSGSSKTASPDPVTATSATGGASTIAVTSSAAPKTTTPPSDTVAASTSAPTTSAPTTSAPAASRLGDPADCPLGALDKIDGKVTITFWYPVAGQRGDVIADQVKRFNESQDKVVVVASYESGNIGTELNNKFLATIGTGQGPDLVSDSAPSTQSMIDSDAIVPMGACVEADGLDLSDVIPAVQATGMNGDTLVAMPWGSSGQVLFYDKSDFRKAGLDPDKPPTTLEDIRVASKAIMKAGAAKHGLAVYASGIMMQGMFRRSGEPWAPKGAVGNRADASNINGEFGQRLMRELNDMADTGELVAFAPSATSFADDLLAIASGDAAMAISPAGNLGQVEAAIKSGVAPGVEAGVGFAPSFGGQVTSTMEGSGLLLWTIQNGDPAKVEAAYRLAKFMMEPAQIADWVIRTGSIAIRTKAAQDPALVQYWAEHPAYRVATDQITDPNTPAVANEGRYGPTSVFNIADSAAIDILINGADVTTRLAQAGKEADTAIADYNARSGG
jgi:sn-glycerol 3-phosphate transport system substrate-binding protein